MDGSAERGRRGVRRSRRVRSIGDGEAVEAEGVIAAWIVGDEDDQAEVVGQDVGEFEPPAVVLHPLPAGLVGLIPADWEADGLVDFGDGIAWLEDDKLDCLAQGLVSHVVELPRAKADQGAEFGVEGGVGQRGREPPRISRRLQLLSRIEPDEQDNEQVCA